MLWLLVGLFVWMRGLGGVREGEEGTLLLDAAVPP